jgi:hypothetical protein
MRNRLPALPSELNDRVQLELLTDGIFANPDCFVVNEPMGRNRQIIGSRHIPENPPGQIVF